MNVYILEDQRFKNNNLTFHLGKLKNRRCNYIQRKMKK